MTAPVPCLALKTRTGILPSPSPGYGNGSPPHLQVPCCSFRPSDPVSLQPLVAEGQEGLPWPPTASSSKGFSGRRDFLLGWDLAPSLSTAGTL
ncbi:unnamed protein product [Lota lota]